MTVIRQRNDCVLRPKRFVGLHAHTTASIFDAIGFPKDNFDFVIEQGGDAMAITEHGNANSFCHAYLYAKELRARGINFKYIPGVEFYVHPDLRQWKIAFEDRQANKSKKKKRNADESVPTIEDESTSKTNRFLDPIQRRHHLVVIAQNRAGLENLFRLVSRGYREGFYRFPRIDYDMLRERSEGLVVLSACVAGVLSYDVLSSFADVPWDQLGPRIDRFEEVQAKLQNSVDKIAEAVGKDKFFPEIQFNAIPAQHLVNMHLIELSKRTGLKLVATADSHYCRPELWKSREIYKKLGWLNYEKINPESVPQSIDQLKCELYPKNADQMWDSYLAYCSNHEFYDDAVVKDAIELSWDIAHDLIDHPDPDTSVKLPSYIVSKERDADAELADLAWDGLRIKNRGDDPIYVDRLKYELDVIREKKFATYFLLVKKIIDIANKEMLVGPGRGSSAGSLLCYCIGITQIDPICHDLLFERFYGRERVDPPDIDSDFGDRDRLITMLKEELGDSNVVPISNYNTFKLKSLIKDLARFHGIPFTDVNRVMNETDHDVRSKTLKVGDDKSGFSLTYEDSIKYSSAFRVFMTDHPELIEHLNVLLKQNRNIGKHAGGIVVGENLDKVMPLITVKGELQTPWVEGLNEKHLPKFGILKVDALGLDTLRVIQRCIELILVDTGIERPMFADVKKWYDTHLHPDVLDASDANVYEFVYHRGNFAGVFQLTSRGQQRLFMQAKPMSIVDVAALTAVYRPGPLAAGVDRSYIDAKRDPGKILYEHPVIEKILSKTYGQIIFQEQAILLAHELANMPMDECDRLRKTLTKRTIAGKDKANEELEALKKRFIGGVIANGLDEKFAEEIFAKIKAFASYAFNKSCDAFELVDIHHLDGRIKATIPMRDVKPGDLLRSRDEKTHCDILVPVIANHDHGILELVEVEFDTGEKIKCTWDHKFRTKEASQMLPLWMIVRDNFSIVVSPSKNVG